MVNGPGVKKTFCSLSYAHLFSYTTFVTIKKTIKLINIYKKQSYYSEKERKKNVNAHNYGQWIGVEKDLSVIEPHTIYFVNITVMKKETLRLMKNEFILSIFNLSVK